MYEFYLRNLLSGFLFCGVGGSWCWCFLSGFVVCCEYDGDGE